MRGRERVGRARAGWATFVVLLGVLAFATPVGAQAPVEPVAAPPAPAEEVGAPVTSGAAAAVSQVSVGENHACGVHPTGSLTCWGGYSGQLAMSEFAGPVRSVSAANRRTCVVRMDGSLACDGFWDDRATPEGSFSSVATADHGGSCAVRTDGSVACWDSGTVVETPGPFASVGVGIDACGLRPTGEIACWGVPSRAAPPTGTFTSLGVGSGGTCAVATGGSISCWGPSSLGNPPAISARSISVGHTVACAVRTDDTVVCWGTGPAALRTPPAGAFASISVGPTRACGVRPAGGVECWGDGDATTFLPPTRDLLSVSVGVGDHVCGIDANQALSCPGSAWATPPPTGQVWSVDVGVDHGCAVLAGGALSCWGNNDSGKAAPPPGTFVSVSAGDDKSCGIRADGELRCWGRPFDTICTSGSPARSCLDEPGLPWLPPSGTFTQVEVAGYFACALRVDGTLACWGAGFMEELVPPPGRFRAVSVAVTRACATDFDGQVVCWGDEEDRADPPPIPLTSVSAGSDHTCGIDPDRHIRCWGAPEYYRDPPAGEYVSVVTGGYESTTCGVRVDRVLQCWGWSMSLGEPFDEAAPGSSYHPITPTRVLDSRTGVGFAGTVTATTPRSLAVAGTGPGTPSAAVPATARAVVLNVTVTDSTAESFLTVHPSGSPPPSTSNLNFGAGQTVPNLVTVQVGTGGRIDLRTAVGATNVVADLVGWFDDGTGPGDRFVGVTPRRLLDSRTSTGGWSAPLRGGSPRALAVEAPGAAGGIPATATAVVANVTVTGGTEPSFVSVWPSDRPQPNVSNLNFLPGQTRANLVVVATGADGSIRAANAHGSVHVVVDVVGYFDPTTGSRFHPVGPARFLDSRVARGLMGPQGPGPARSVAVAGATGTTVPAGATGIVANLTIADGTAETYLSAFPGGEEQPDPYSTLNAGPGQVVPNLTMVGLGPAGDLGIANHRGDAAVIGDVVGYFAPV